MKLISYWSELKEELCLFNNAYSFNINCVIETKVLGLFKKRDFYRFEICVYTGEIFVFKNDAKEPSALFSYYDNNLHEIYSLVLEAMSDDEYELHRDNYEKLQGYRESTYCLSFQDDNIKYINLEMEEMFDKFEDNVLLEKVAVYGPVTESFDWR